MTERTGEMIRVMLTAFFAGIFGGATNTVFGLEWGLVIWVVSFVAYIVICRKNLMEEYLYLVFFLGAGAGLISSSLLNLR